MKHLFLCLALLLIGTSCATKKLWEGYVPGQKVWISADNITERELIDSGVEYQHYYSETGPGYLVDKSAARNIGGFVYRAFATPVTLAVDTVAGAVTTVFIVGSMLPIGGLAL
ncbi:MAG: hypothetical protein AAF492_27355 [Verrucomicrobiota bacterium]